MGGGYHTFVQLVTSPLCLYILRPPSCSAYKYISVDPDMLNSMILWTLFASLCSCPFRGLPTYYQGLVGCTDPRGIQQSPTQPKMKRWDPRNSGAGWPQAGPRHVKARSGQLVTLSANKRERTGAVSRFLLIGWIPESAPCGIVTAASARRLHEPHGQSR